MATYSKRTHARELPSTQEIMDMMASEAQRAPSVLDHFPDFSVANQWLKVLAIESEIFNTTNTIEEVNKASEKIKQLVVDKTLELRPIKQLEMVEKYLGETDPLIESDIAIVFGGKTLSRAEKSAEMYLAGFTKKLLMTGKGPNYKGVFDKTEAEVFKNRAVELGVPEDKIICEDKALTIASNVRGSLNLLDEMGIKYQSLMSIISWYGQRRAWCTFKKYIRPNIQLIRVNSDLPKRDGKIHPYTIGLWYQSGEGIEIVFNEFVKMRHQVVTNTG
jgi:hypothetical protein